MRGESKKSRALLKGYLLEIVLLKLLKLNNYIPVDPMHEPTGRVRKFRRGFMEFKGRGCWHQIDLPCDYNRRIPFIYPIRLLGEAKYHKTPISKKYIREYIGVLKDIQENYFVADGDEIRNLAQRRIEVGTIFSASGFQVEAEKLAYAHGIKTISYKNNLIFKRICEMIEYLEEFYLSVDCIRNNNWNSFSDAVTDYLNTGNIEVLEHVERFFENDYKEVFKGLYDVVYDIKTSFIGTTGTGFVMHFVSHENFPGELFEGTDFARCRVYYDRYEQEGERFFWIEFVGDNRHGRFYFTPPESLDEAAVFGGEIVLNEKARVFRALNISIELNGIARNLVVEMDNDWIDSLR